MSQVGDSSDHRLRVLFVDDEQHVLDGLRRSLRAHRGCWGMTFLADPRKALELVKDEEFDVVVSDMRMPWLTGAELLEAVREIRPGAVRIMLSGHAEVASIMKSVGPSHQFLSKPCEVDALASAIQRSRSLDAHLKDESLRRLVGGIETLPSLPSVYRELVEAIREERPMREIGEIISRDIAMTAKLLKVVNSSYFGPARTVTDPGQAAMMLGVELVQGLVLGSKIFEQLPASLPKAEIEKIWQRSSRMSALAQQVAQVERLSDVMKSQLFVSSMLADVGLLILQSHRRDQMLEVERIAEASARAHPEVEREVLGATHGDVGAHLAALWGFAAPVVEAIAYHDHPSAVAHRDVAPVTYVHASHALIQELDDGVAPDASPLDLTYLEAVGVADRVAGWREKCARFLCEAVPA